MAHLPLARISGKWTPVFGKDTQNKRKQFTCNCFGKVLVYALNLKPAVGYCNQALSALMVFCQSR